MSPQELSSYGHPQHEMPMLDRLAQEGLQFLMAFATPICRASRVEIMTGQYGFRNGVYNNGDRRAGDLNPGAERMKNHLTFAHILRDAGYATAMTGKWGIAGRITQQVAQSGFDEYMMYAKKHELPTDTEHTGAFHSRGQTSPYWHPSIVTNGAYMPTNPDDYGPDLYTDFMIDFARRHRDQPFFVYFAMNLPHDPFWPTPLSVSSASQRLVDDKDNFSHMVEYIDVLIGRLVQALEEMGLRDNTVILFTSDNGSGLKSSAIGNRIGKGYPIELGVQVPMIVSAPGIMQSIGRSRALVDFTDILPTLADLAGTELPPSAIFDGHSFAPLMHGESYTPREWIFGYLGDRRILRDQRWLLEHNSPHQFGQLFDCGEALNRDECTEVTDTAAPEAMLAQSQFEAILANLPAPLLPIRINFQPEDADLPAEKFEDDTDFGEVFADHSQKRIRNQMRSGVSYGWSMDHTAEAAERDRNGDQRLDTLVPFRAGSQWEITLAAGDYYVMVILGDAASSSTHTLNVEGINYWDAVTVGRNDFLQKEMLVSVTDGRLTLDSGDAPDLSTRINYMEITPASYREEHQDAVRQ